MFNKNTYVTLLLLLVINNSAYAYLGPGMGAGAIATIIGILGSILLVIVGIFYYPVKRAIKKRKQEKIKNNAEH